MPRTLPHVADEGFGPALDVLVVDDEAPARAELAYLLGEDPRVGTVLTAADADAALRTLSDTPVEVVFCDIKMPRLGGLELARVMSRFVRRPQIVFVTAYDEHAVDAFELQATDYVMKPVRRERLAEAVRRVVMTGSTQPTPTPADEIIPVELGGITRFVRRSQVRFVEAQGDYARLHTASGSHLLRTSLSQLEDAWSGAGFVRIHRSTLVAIDHIDEVRVSDGHTTVRLGSDELVVSRRHSRLLRDRLASR
jgi:DNA-binding LytR/AlgR family response regulator